MIREGSKITWKWGSGNASGTVKETYTEEVSKPLKERLLPEKEKQETKLCILNKKMAITF